MQKYLSVDEMIQVEKAADAAGHTYEKMMACAGKSLADAILYAYSHNRNKKMIGLIGSGNNGGDGLIGLTHLAIAGWEVVSYLVKDRREDPLVKSLVNAGGRVVWMGEDEDFSQLSREIEACDFLLDGILGTGIKLPLRDPVPALLTKMNTLLEGMNKDVVVIAVDCPSGVDCDSGEAAESCIPADLTVCMSAVKQGLLKLPAYAYLGDLVVGDIGLPDNLPVWDKIERFVLDEAYFYDVIPERALDGHKGTFGTAMIVGGSKNYTGAPLLAGKAAFRSGAGWVQMVVPEVIHMVLAGNYVEATWLPMKGNAKGFVGQDGHDLMAEMGKATAILLGPGFGMGEEVKAFVETLVGYDLPPAVVDADGLKLLSQIDHWWEKLPENSILTPHPGEMSIITGLSTQEIQSDRVRTAEKFADKWGHVVVLKGTFTVVAAPGGKTAILPIATPALGRAGTGDVLAGIITGLRAQGMKAFDAAAAGVWAHAQAGLTAAVYKGSTAGVLAGDLIEVLPEIMPY